MIWYFLAGWIAGVVGVIMLLHWWIRTHMEVIESEEDTEEENADD